MFDVLCHLLVTIILVFLILMLMYEDWCAISEAGWF